MTNDFMTLYNENAHIFKKKWNITEAAKTEMWLKITDQVHAALKTGKRLQKVEKIFSLGFLSHLHFNSICVFEPQMQPNRHQMDLAEG